MIQLGLRNPLIKPVNLPSPFRTDVLLYEKFKHKVPYVSDNLHLNELHILHEENNQNRANEVILRTREEFGNKK